MCSVFLCFGKRPLLWGRLLAFLSYAALPSGAVGVCPSFLPSHFLSSPTPDAPETLSCFRGHGCPDPLPSNLVSGD